MRVVFMGTPAFAVPSLDALARAGHDLVAVVAQPDRPAGRGQGLREPATKAWARARGVPVLQPLKVRDGKLAAELTALRPDVLCVAAYGRILGKDLLTLAPHGAINVHGSLLPKYRGAAPIQWAVANGERETGVSIMQMDEGLDTGDVLLQRVLPIAPADTAETLGPRLAALGGEALVEALAGLAAGTLTPVRQDERLATLARILEREDGKVDWSRPANVIQDRLRGFQPWPGAWTTLEGKVVKLLEVEPCDPAGLVPGTVGPVPGTGTPGTPGTPVPGTETAETGAATLWPAHGLLVRCAAGSSLLLKRLQPEGRGPQAATDFANGLRRKQLKFGT